MMEELRKSITMDNHDAVKIGDLEKTQESLPVLNEAQVHLRTSLKRWCLKERMS